MATGTIMPTPYQSVFDSNGDPVSGGLVYTYTAGTTTPVATYSDVSLLVPNANPIVADSSGRFVAYLTPGLSYKFAYQTSAGVAIRTVDNILAMPGTTNPSSVLSVCEVRLSLTSGTPVTITDVTAATTVYVTLYKGNRIALYDGSTWNLREVTANTPITVPATTSTVYDVFCYDSATVPTFETLAWTNDTTRATALTTQDGVLCKSGSVTRRYIGSFRTTAVSGQTEDSLAKRLVWNYNNRAQRPMRVLEATDSWAYTTDTYRQANASTANQLAVLNGFPESGIDVNVVGFASNSSANIRRYVAIGEDSTSAGATGLLGMLSSGSDNAPANSIYRLDAALRTIPAVGYHFYAWLERSEATGTCTWRGDDGAGIGATKLQAGIIGTWWS